MKRLVYTVFVAFWSSIGTLLVVHAQTKAPAKPAAPAERVFTLAQVGEHAKLEDCWMAIRGGVYDLTAYVPQHPTSKRVLQPWCGTDATEGMDDKGIGRPHSEQAWKLLEQYRIGVLKKDR